MNPYGKYLFLYRILKIIYNMLLYINMYASNSKRNLKAITKQFNGGGSDINVLISYNNGDIVGFVSIDNLVKTLKYNILRNAEPLQGETSLYYLLIVMIPNRRFGKFGMDGDLLIKAHVRYNGTFFVTMLDEECTSSQLIEKLEAIYNDKMSEPPIINRFDSQIPELVEDYRQRYTQVRKEKKQTTRQKKERVRLFKQLPHNPKFMF